ncbi:MAG: hypothetical protein LUE99_12735 [Bacteroides sp.]|nr:hypothetical protein [Bacteroides sp.]
MERCFGCLKTLYVDGNYHDADINARALTIKAYNDYKEVADDAEATDAAKAEAKTKFAGKLKTYLTERAKLDGFKITKAGDAEKVIDPTVEADFTQWVGIATEDEQFGPATILEGGAYKAYKEAAEAIGYVYVINPKEGRCVEYTYAEYDKDGDLTGAEAAAWNGGSAKIAFEARAEYEEQDSKVTNKPDWDKLYADLKAVSDSNDKALDDLNLLIAAAAAERDEVTAEYAAKESAIDVETEGIQTILDKIKAVIAGAGASGSTYDQVLQDLKDKIAALESGTVDDSNDDYIFANGSESIPTQKVVIASYEKLLAALKDGSYKPAEDALIAQKQAEIESKQVEIEACEALFKSLSAKKDQLLEALAGSAE